MRRLDSQQDIANANLIVGPRNCIGQSFSTRRNNIAGIRMLVYNYRLGGKTEYLLSLKDDKDNILQKLTVSESNVGWEYTLRYDFLPVKSDQSINYKFSLCLKEENSDTFQEDGPVVSDLNLKTVNDDTAFFIEPELEDQVPKRYFSVAYNRSDLYQGGSAYINDQKLPGDLHFQIYYQTTLKDFIKDSLTDFSKHVSYDSSFFLFYLIFIFILILSIVKRITNHR